MVLQGRHESPTEEAYPVGDASADLPIPARDQLTLRLPVLPERSYLTWELFDAKGRRLAQPQRWLSAHQPWEEAIDVRTLPPGRYMRQITCWGQQQLRYWHKAES